MNSIENAMDFEENFGLHGIVQRLFKDFPFMVHHLKSCRQLVFLADWSWLFRRKVWSHQVREHLRYTTEQAVLKLWHPKSIDLRFVHLKVVWNFGGSYWLGNFHRNSLPNKWWCCRGMSMIAGGGLEEDSSPSKLTSVQDLRYQQISDEPMGYIEIHRKSIGWL